MRIILILIWCWYTSIVSCFTSTSYKLRSCVKLSSSSSSEEDSAMENELMKLRARREAIVSSKKEKSPKSKLDDLTSPQEGIIEGAQGGGLASLPPRPKKFRTMEEKYSSSKRKSSSSFSDKNTSPPKIMDYQMDYDDENDLHIPNRIGFSSKNIKNYQVFERLINGGISFVDTSDKSSNTRKVGGWSERVPNFPLLALNKGRGWGWNSSHAKAITKSCSKMETSCIELYQIPPPLLKSRTCDELAAILQKGYCNHVGIGKGVRSPRILKSLHKTFSKKSVTLSSCQFEFSLTQRRHLNLIELSKQLGIIPIARSPLDHGLASGVYTASNPSGGKFSKGKIKYPFKVLEPLIPLQDAQKKVAEKVYNRLENEFLLEREARLNKFKSKKDFSQAKITLAQVAINYVVAKGAVPIPSISNEQEAQELLGCLGWGLLPEEVALLDDAAEQIF